MPSGLRHCLTPKIYKVGSFLRVSLFVSARILASRADHNPVFSIELIARYCLRYNPTTNFLTKNQTNHYLKKKGSKKSLTTKGNQETYTISFSKLFTWSSDAGEPTRAQDLEEEKNASVSSRALTLEGFAPGITWNEFRRSATELVTSVFHLFD